VPEKAIESEIERKLGELKTEDVNGRSARITLCGGGVLKEGVSLKGN